MERYKSYQAIEYFFETTPPIIKMAKVEVGARVGLLKRTKCKKTLEQYEKAKENLSIPYGILKSMLDKSDADYTRLGVQLYEIFFEFLDLRIDSLSRFIQGESVDYQEVENKSQSILIRTSCKVDAIQPLHSLYYALIQRQN